MKVWYSSHDLNTWWFVIILDILNFEYQSQGSCLPGNAWKPVRIYTIIHKPDPFPLSSFQMPLPFEYQTLIFPVFRWILYYLGVRYSDRNCIFNPLLQPWQPFYPSCCSRAWCWTRSPRAEYPPWSWVFSWPTQADFSIWSLCFGHLLQSLVKTGSPVWPIIDKARWHSYGQI